MQQHNNPSPSYPTPVVIVLWLNVGIHVIALVLATLGVVGAICGCR